MDKPLYHNSKSARTAGKQSQGTYKQRSFIIGQNRRDVKSKKSVSCAQKSDSERYLAYMQRLEEIRRL